MGADIALFPEMWNIGYMPFGPWEQPHAPSLWRAPERWARSELPVDVPGARARWQEQAVGRDGAFVAGFVGLARELNLAIALTYLERSDGSPRNTVSLIDRHGTIVMTYAKVHTCDFGMEDALTPGDDFYVGTLDTAQGEINVGAMICHDREFPESARILMLKGAELILTPNACPLDPNRLGQFRARAFENMVGVAMANYAAPQENGHSVAYDPMAYDAQGRARDTLIIEAGESEGIYLAPFDLRAIREYRQREVWGNAFRRPLRYGLMTSLEVRAPFVRTNAHGNAWERTKDSGGIYFG